MIGDKALAKMYSVNKDDYFNSGLDESDLWRYINMLLKEREDLIDIIDHFSNCNRNELDDENSLLNLKIRKWKFSFYM